MSNWIWKHVNWPDFHWDDQMISPHLAQARLAQGKLLGTIHLLDQETLEQIDFATLTSQAINTAAIEGEHLNRDSVRSSIARRLGIEHAGLDKPADRKIEGLLDMLLDATGNYQQALSLKRLYGWHAALFPTGYSGIEKIIVGALRQADDMQIISGRPGKEKVHYEAPPAKEVLPGMKKLLNWFNDKNNIDGLVKAAIAHLWFELLHPFEDGNGRLGRALIDLALAQDEKLNIRYYSLSSAIMHDRKNYYAQLETSCKGDLDISRWIIWFLNCFEKAVNSSLQTISNTRLKSQFWNKHATTVLNERQIKALNRLLDEGTAGFTGNLTTKKYANLTKTSRATAYRELHDLLQKNCLCAVGQGRSAGYQIQW
jgi:Fic family protein